MADSKETISEIAPRGPVSEIHPGCMYLVMPVIPLDLVGARSIPLTVTRAADDQRVYLKTEAGSTSAPFSLYVE